MATRRYDEALVWVDRFPENLPDSGLPAELARAEALEGMGREEDARRHVQQALKSNPNLSLRDYRSHPIKHQADLDHILDGLRKAGIPDE